LNFDRQHPAAADCWLADDAGARAHCDEQSAAVRNLGVVNGDTGIVAAAAPGEVAVEFVADREIAYDPVDLIDLDHAYCFTVHRAQGSEWPEVVLPASSGYALLLSRILLYTAPTTGAEGNGDRRRRGRHCARRRREA
jgi:ATP-dependent exoDNAse (exonuclease V) alpha subunit